MAADKFTATWISHSSISDFLKCPRAYYLKNMYKDPKTGHKIQLMSPPLALGQAVHEVIESLSILPTELRFNTPLLEKYEKVWTKISGKRGGFTSEDTEHRYKERGAQMLRRVTNNPGPLANKAVKLKEKLPSFWLSEDDNIILCGKIDWMEYITSDDSVHIIDFKTSKSEEDGQSLQLPIYILLASRLQKRPVTKISYWYLDFSDYLTTKELPETVTAEQELLRIGKQIKLARQLNKLECKTGGCRHCAEMERILQGEGELVGMDETNKDIYILPSAPVSEDDSVIL